jgi:hypothetical protein
VVNGWIPAFAGMTEVWQGEGCWEWLDSRLRGNDRGVAGRGVLGMIGFPPARE